MASIVGQDGRADDGVGEENMGVLGQWWAMTYVFKTVEHRQAAQALFEALAFAKGKDTSWTWTGDATDIVTKQTRRLSLEWLFARVTFTGLTQHTHTHTHTTPCCRCCTTMTALWCSS